MSWGGFILYIFSCKHATAAYVRVPVIRELTFKNVQPFVSGGELERQRGMVRFQNADVVVQQGQIVLGVTQERTTRKQIITHTVKRVRVTGDSQHF